MLILPADEVFGTHRAYEGKLKGWALTWLDGTQVKWFAWAAEHPETTIYMKRSGDK